MTFSAHPPQPEYQPAPYTSPAATTLAEPAPRRGVLARIGAWFSVRRIVAAVAVPAGLWLVGNAVLGRYPVDDGIAGAALLAIVSVAVQKPAPAEDEAESAGLARRLLRRIRGLLWLAYPVVYEMWMYHDMGKAGPWVFFVASPLLLAGFYGLAVWVEPKDGHPRRPLLGIPARVAVVAVGFFVTLAGLLGTDAKHWVGLAIGLLVTLLGFAMVIMGGLGLPTTVDPSALPPSPDGRTGDPAPALSLPADGAAK